MICSFNIKFTVLEIEKICSGVCDNWTSQSSCRSITKTRLLNDKKCFDFFSLLKCAMVIINEIIETIKLRKKSVKVVSFFFCFFSSIKILFPYSCANYTSAFKLCISFQNKNDKKIILFFILYHCLCLHGIFFISHRCVCLHIHMHRNDLSPFLLS